MLKVKSLSQVLLSAFLIRLLVTGASIGDALSLLSLSGLYGLWLVLDHKKEPEANKELKDRLVSVEEKAQKTENKIGAMTVSGNLRR